MSTGTTIIVSNRLPVKIVQNDDGYIYLASEGGLATGLSCVFEKNDIWIGWPGISPDEKDEEKISDNLRSKGYYPVFLSAEEIKEFYEGFSNQVIWPLFHYFPSYTNFSKEAWDTYQKVNQKYADAILSICNKEDTVWIHDYHLMLVPALVRTKMPDVRIGYFQHIPFPSYEIFRMLPWRNELLEGLMKADLIGFQTLDDVHYFKDTISRLLNVHSSMNEFYFDGNMGAVQAFPIGTSYDKFKSASSEPTEKKYVDRIRERSGNKKIIISIDRLDYSKGIVHRLKAFQRFLEKYPSFIEEVAFFQLVVPSRDNVEQYKEIKEEINRTVSEINSSFATISWQPIFYFYRSWPFQALVALYVVADLVLVTPLRDGMNLVCKEYIAAHPYGGALVLSEMAGAAKELNEALIINPLNEEESSDAMFSALSMDIEEQERRMEIMRCHIRRYDIHHWKKCFFERLEIIKQKQMICKGNKVSADFIPLLQRNYYEAKKRLLFLDYDGTLVPFKEDPELAIPDKEMYGLLEGLCKDERNKIVIISGRQKETLSEWFGSFRLDLIAEHGAWRREFGKCWKRQLTANNAGLFEIAGLLQQYVGRVPGSFVELKDFSVAWHCRKSDPVAGRKAAKEIIDNLGSLIADLGFDILKGNDGIEIKKAGVNKGVAAQEWLMNFPASFMLAIGDDLTDEDIFRVLPHNAFSVKVGAGSSIARYRLGSSEQVRGLLEALCKECKDGAYMPVSAEIKSGTGHFNFGQKLA